MNFSTKGEYGLRAAVSLAKSYPVKKTIKEISIEEKISVKYLERLAGDSRRGGIVKSVKGKNGGYVLAESPAKIKVGKIIESVEGPILVKCFGARCKLFASRTGTTNAGHTNEKMIAHQCPSSFVWMKLGEQIKKTLYGIRLSDLIK